MDEYNPITSSIFCFLRDDFSRMRRGGQVLSSMFSEMRFVIILEMYTSLLFQRQSGVNDLLVVV